MNKTFLPVGSVVLLKNATKKIMITGFCSLSPEHQGKLFDYTGCLYPEGLLSSDQICLFDHDQIGEVFYKGFENEEEKEFKTKLLDSYDKMIEMVNTKLQEAS